MYPACSRGMPRHLLKKSWQPCCERCVLDEYSGISSHQQRNRLHSQYRDDFAYRDAWSFLADVAIFWRKWPDDCPQDTKHREGGKGHFPAQHVSQRDRSGGRGGNAPAHQGGIQGVDDQHFLGTEPLHHQRASSDYHQRQAHTVGQAQDEQNVEVWGDGCEGQQRQGYPRQHVGAFDTQPGDDLAAREPDSCANQHGQRYQHACRPVADTVVLDGQGKERR